MSCSLLDLYALLGVPYGASAAVINKAFRKLSISCHPDKLPAAERAAGEARFKQLSTARDTLIDPAACAKWEAQWQKQSQNTRKQEHRSSEQHGWNQQNQQRNQAQPQGDAWHQGWREDDFSRDQERWNNAAGYQNSRWNQFFKQWSASNASQSDANEFGRSTFDSTSGFGCGAASLKPNAANHGDEQMQDRDQGVYRGRPQARGGDEGMMDVDEEEEEEL